MASGLTGWRIFISPVCVRSSEFVVRTFSFYYVDLAAVRPFSVFLIFRTQPKTRPSALILWHFYASFNVTLAHIKTVSSLYKSRSEVSGFGVTCTGFSWFI